MIVRRPGLVQRFHGDRRGNVAVIFALASLPLLAFAGAALSLLAILALSWRKGLSPVTGSARFRHRRRAGDIADQRGADRILRRREVDLRHATGPGIAEDQRVALGDDADRRRAGRRALAGLFLAG